MASIFKKQYTKPLPEGADGGRRIKANVVTPTVEKMSRRQAAPIAEHLEAYEANLSAAGHRAGGRRREEPPGERDWEGNQPFEFYNRLQPLAGSSECF